MGKPSVYHARSAKAIGEAIPEFPTTSVDLIVGYLLVAADDYSVYAAGPFQVPEFDFLYSDKKVSTVFLNYPATAPIATINGRIALTNQVDSSLGQSLLKMAKPSLVGKNENTELDESVRKSSEILADQIELDADFFAMISQEIQVLAQTLGHPTNVMAKLHKLVVYKEGDFFDTHIDSPHNNAEPMIFTASVHLSMNSWRSSGGRLVVGKYEIRSPQNEELGLTLFYHDEPHSVTEVGSGNRVSLVFDVVDLGTPTATPTSSVAVPEVLSKMFSLGFNKVAIRTSHTYFSSHEVSPEQLKGTDKVFYELMMTHGAKCVEICEVFEDEQGRIFRREVLDVMQLGSSFRSLYYSPREEFEEEEEEEEEEDEEKKEKEDASENNDDDQEEESKLNCGKRQRRGQKEEGHSKMKRARVEYDREISPRYDTDNKAFAIKNKCRLGDTFFLSVTTPRVLAYSSREGVQLGNEGFNGKIFSNLAIIAHF